MSIAVLLFCPASQAQAQPSAAAETAAKPTGRLSACKSGKMQCVRKTSPKIVNPQAGQSVDPNLAILRSQKQNADLDANSKSGSTSKKTFGDGSRNGITDGATQAARAPRGGNSQLPAVQTPGVGGAGAVNGDGKVATQGQKSSAVKDSRTATRGQTSAIPIIKANGAGSGPMQTESATGSPPPGSPAQTQPSALVGCPNITGISGFPTAIFTPIPLFNPYTIKGCGFGDQPGSVYLTGPFYHEQIFLTVQKAEATSSRRGPGLAWSDTSITVSVDPQLRGELNQLSVTLVVQPVKGAPIQKAGNKFLAFDEDTTLPIPKNLVTFFKGGSTPDALYSTPPQNGMSADVFRESTTLNFFPTGSDLFDLSGLFQGFQPAWTQLYHDDPTGCSTAGTWNVAWEGQKVRVTWEEFQCGPEIWSDYDLNVTVRGPRGIDPWTGRPILNISTAPAQRLKR